MLLRLSICVELRKKIYKIGVDVDEVRWRREDNFVEIRKNKCEDSFFKKCCEGMMF